MTTTTEPPKVLTYLRATEQVVTAAVAADLPAPEWIEIYSFGDPLKIQLDTLADLTAWAEWLDNATEIRSFESHDTGGRVWVHHRAEGTSLEQPVNLSSCERKAVEG